MIELLTFSFINFLRVGLFLLTEIPLNNSVNFIAFVKAIKLTELFLELYI